MSTETVALVGTRKGLWIGRSDESRKAWTWDGPHFNMQEVYSCMVDTRGGRTRLFAGAASSWVGPQVAWSDDLGAQWEHGPDGGIRFPADTGASVERIWQLQPGIGDDVVWAGTEPGAVWRSEDRGESFTLERGLWDHPQRPEWGAGYGGQAFHTVLPHPSDPESVTAAISTGGVYQTTDGGRTWTEPKILSDDDPKDMYVSVIPMISVAPNGRIDVAFWDTRSDPGIRGNDVYYTYSTDGGENWAKNVRVTDQTINRNYGVWGFNYDVTPPIGVASTNQLAVFAWDDTRNSDAGLRKGIEPGAGVQDIYAATVQHEVVGGGSSKTTKVIIAGLIGLAGVAIVLLTAALVMRRGSSGPEKKAKAKTTAKTTAKV